MPPALVNVTCYNPRVICQHPSMMYTCYRVICHASSTRQWFSYKRTHQWEMLVPFKDLDYVFPTTYWRVPYEWHFTLALSQCIFWVHREIVILLIYFLYLTSYQLYKLFFIICVYIHNMATPSECDLRNHKCIIGIAGNLITNTVLL